MTAKSSAKKELFQSTFVDKQLILALVGFKKQLAEGKPIVEQPVQRPVDPEKKAVEKKAAGIINPAKSRIPFVDAILEYWRVQPDRRVQFL